MVAVVVTLTTIPGRVHLLWPVLNSLLHRQTQPPAAVVVNLPREYGGGLGEIKQTPAGWRSGKGVRLIINRDCTDLGPGTKLVGAAGWLSRFSDALVIYLDDDHVPNTFFVEAHARAHRRLSRPAVFCGRGEIVLSTDPFRRDIRSQRDPSAAVHVPSGVGSVSVPLRELRIERLAARVARATPTARMADDIIFADWFARQKLPVITLGINYLLEVQPHAVDEWALHRTLRDDCPVVPEQRYATAVAELGASFGPLSPPASVQEAKAERAPRATLGRRRMKMWKGQPIKDGRGQGRQD